MPQVGNNNEPLHERALYGFDGSLWKPLQLDTNGYIQVSLPDIEIIEVTQDTAGDLLATVNIATDQNVQARNHGYVAGDWQKDPIRFGFSDQVGEQVVNNNLAAGFNLLKTTAVPSGEVHVIKNISARYAGTVTTVFFIVYHHSQFGDLSLYGTTTVVANTIYDRQTDIVMIEDDYIQLGVFNATLNDDAELNITGYKVDVDL